MQNLGPPEIFDGGNIAVQDFSLECSDGITLVGQQWYCCSITSSAASSENNHYYGSGENEALRILCLHGFLDNCRSFAALVPRLLDGIRRLPNPPSCVQMVAFDFPGHGKSSWKSMDHPPYSMIGDIVFYVAQVAQLLKWNRFVLMGHSMGAMASILYAGAFPESVQQLILLDGFGPDFERPNRVVDRLRQHILKRYSGNEIASSLHVTTEAARNGTESTQRRQQKNSKRIYKSVDDAIRMRQETATKSPGNQWLSYQAAKEMVVWALEPAAVSVIDASRSSSPSPLGWTFQHDSRLYWPALQAHTLEQAFDYWKSLRDDGNVPTLWLRAQDGWPFSKKWLDRAETFLGPLGTIQTLPGSHHFHSDPETVDRVAEAIVEHLATNWRHSKSTTTSTVDTTASITTTL